MNTIELAQSIADYFQCPVKIIRKNPLEYQQTDHSLILRQGIQNLPIEERRKIARQIASTATGTKPEERKQYSSIENFEKLPKKKRIALAKKLVSQDWVLRETKQATLEGNRIAAGVPKVEPEKPSSLKDSFIVGLKKTRPIPKVRINAPDDVAKFLDHVTDYDRERAKIIHLDTKNQVVGVENISTGSLNASIVHPREAVKGAVLNNSNAVIFVHNHPSGNPEPSREDLDVHQRLKNAFGTVGIELLDSIIIGKNGHVSLKERGL